MSLSLSPKQSRGVLTHIKQHRGIEPLRTIDLLPPGWYFSYRYILKRGDVMAHGGRPAGLSSVADKIRRLLKSGESIYYITSSLSRKEGYGANCIEQHMREFGFETLLIKPAPVKPFFELYITDNPVCFVSKDGKKKECNELSDFLEQESDRVRIFKK